MVNTHTMFKVYTASINELSQTFQQWFPVIYTPFPCSHFPQDKHIKITTDTFHTSSVVLADDIMLLYVPCSHLHINWLQLHVAGFSDSAMSIRQALDAYKGERLSLQLEDTIADMQSLQPGYWPLLCFHVLIQNIQKHRISGH